MTLTLVSRKGKAVNPYRQEVSKDRSLFGGVVRQGVKGVERLAEGAAFPADIAQTAIQAVGAPIQNALGLNKPIERAQEQFSPEYVAKLHPSVRERIGEFQKATGGKQELPSQTIRRAAGSVLPKEYLESENPVEKVIDTTISALPFRFALGAPDVVKALAQEVGGSIGRVGAEEAGFGALGQIAGGLAGSSAFGNIKDSIVSRITGEEDPTKLANLAETARTKFYAKERELGSNLFGKGSEYKNKLSEIEQSIAKTSVLKDVDKKDLLDKIELYKSDIKPGMVNGKVAKDLINASALLERKGEINKLYSKTHDPDVTQYLKRIQKAIFQETDALGKESPEWSKAWKSGDEITKALNYRSDLTSAISRLPIISKIIKSPLAAVALLGEEAIKNEKKPSTLGVLFSPYSKAEQIFGFMKKESTRKLLGEAFKNTVSRNDKNLISVIRKLNDSAEKYEKQNPVLRSSEGLTLVRRRSRH